MEKAKLEEFNHWWMKQRVDPDLALEFKRDLYSKVANALEKRFILALVGLRRVGKTTIIYQLIQHLLSKSVSPKDILFFSFDEADASLSDLITTYAEIHGIDLRSHRAYFFLDEIQKCDNWENELKKYYDLYPKAKFIISGSESLFIRKKTKETLAGRVFEFTLNPLSFSEYLSLSGVPKNEFSYETKIRPLFYKFAKFGGFPETISFSSENDFKSYLRPLVVDRIIYKDIPKLFKIEDPDFLITLLEMISSNPGMQIDYRSLAQQFGKDRRLIKNYLSFLRESFLIKLLGNYRKSATATLRKAKKAYPADTAFTYLYKPYGDESFFGKVVESLLVTQLSALSFWKNGHEVDMVIKDTPIEVKYQEHITSSDLKGVRAFLRKFRQKAGIVATKKDDRVLKVDKGKIMLVPAWKLLLYPNLVKKE